MENNVVFNFNAPSSMSNYNTRGTLNPPYTYSPNYTVAARIYNFDRNNLPQDITDPLQSYKILVTNALDSSTNLYCTAKLVYDPLTNTLSQTINELRGTTIISLEIISILNTEADPGEQYVPIPEGITYTLDSSSGKLSIIIPGFSETYDLIGGVVASVTANQNQNVFIVYS